jgi:cytosine/creatinine deaminase
VIMARGFLSLQGSTHRFARANVPAVLLEAGALTANASPDGLATVDLDIRDGRIERITPSCGGQAPGAVDLDHSQVWPAFVDMHTHLDKGHILPRATNPDGTGFGAVRAVGADRPVHWSANDVRRRFEFGLRCSYAHGTAALRTHLDCEPPQAEISWPVFAELRSAWTGRIDLQGVGKLPLELYPTEYGRRFAAMVAEHGGVLGGVTRIAGLGPKEAAPHVETALAALFTLAEHHTLDIDLHVDESGDPEAQTLGQVARAALRHRFQGQVSCGHCCSLAVQPMPIVDEVLDLCAQAGLAVVTLPMINQYLQGRAGGATPRWRGVTLIHELARRGVPAATASDNCRDPFFAFGDHDMLEVYNQSVRIAHLDLPFGPWPAAATSVPARLMGLGHRGTLRAGAPADLVLFRARTMSELLARPQAERVVLRAGQPINTSLPDHRELDDLFVQN